MKKNKNITHYKVITQYIKPYIVWYIILIALMIFALVLDLLAPLITKSIIDDALAHKDQHLFIKLLLLYLAVFVTYNSLNIFNSYRFLVIAENLALKLRNDVFQKIIHLELKFFENNPLGDLVARVIGDVGTIKDMLVVLVLNIFINLLTFVGTFIMLFYINWRLALFILLITPVYVWLVQYLGIKLHDETKTNREMYAKVNSLLCEYVPQTKTIQAFDQESNVTTIFRKVLEGLRRSNLALEIYKIKGNLFMTFFTGILPFLILGYSGLMILQDKMSIGAWVAVGTYLNQIFQPIRSLVSQGLNYKIGLVSFARISDILNYQSGIVESENPVSLTSLQDNIEFRNVSLSYGEKQVLNSVSFQIKKGERVAIIGETGQGKSTLIDLLLRFREPNSGEVLIDGRNSKDYALTDLRKLFSLTLQDTGIFNGTLQENINFSNKDLTQLKSMYAEERITYWLEKTELANRQTVQYAGRDLSGGQKQIIGIFRALSKDSDVMIFDEPTSAQDALSEKVFKEILQQIKREKTVIIISHRFTLTTDVDRIILLKNGQIAANGTPKEVLNNSLLYRELLEAQIL